MSRIPLIIDCDPGIDDAVNLLFALAAPEELDVLGITTVAGNVAEPLCARNARLMCDLAGRPDVPVFSGAVRPLGREPVSAAHIHGETGLGDYPIGVPQRPCAPTPAVTFLIESLRTAPPGGLTLVLTGPLTNVALALREAPDAARGIGAIVLMGGAYREGGNCTPSAEFNFFADPHAAREVLACRRPITALGLDATHQLPATEERRARLRALDNDVGRAVAQMLDFLHRSDATRHSAAGAPLHDPCTVGYLLAPELFEGRSCNVSVETDSELTLGHSAVDFWHVTDQPHNVSWVHRVDADGFYALLEHRLQRYGG